MGLIKQELKYYKEAYDFCDPIYRKNFGRKYKKSSKNIIF